MTPANKPAEEVPMKALPLIVVLGLALSTPFAFAEDEKADDHASHHPAPTTDSEASRASSDDQAANKPSPAQENMKKVEGLMQQIQKTDDPVEKRQLLADHLQALRDQMRLIRSQHAPMMMSMKEDGKEEAGTKEGMMKKKGMMQGMMKMHNSVEQRLDLLERMMQQLVEREAAKNP
jgi:flagellar biosynthesis/type III secretory pathway protein FliH